MIIWYENERDSALQEEYSQVKAYATQNKLNLENITTENIKLWVRGIKEIKRRLQKMNQDDIRTYFL